MICSVCREEPGVYGDPLTGVRCSKCEREYQQEREGRNQPLQAGDEGFEHKTISGFTSIIMPVCMVNYSIFHYTGNAIGSIREHTDQEKTPYELIVIDNGSPIKPPSLKSYYADKVIQHEKDLGYTLACNKGIRASFGEYIVLINNDTLVFDHWLEELKAVLDSGQADLVMAHPMYSNTEPFARAIEAREVLEGKKQFDPISSDFSCVMFKKELFNEVGGFDEQFFNYCSDTDFLKKMDQLGKKYMVVDKVAIHHISDATGYSINLQQIEELKRLIEEQGTTPEIMNEDKKKFEEKWNSQPQVLESELTEVDSTESGTVFQPAVVKRETFDLIRSVKSGDKIYLMKEGKRHWIRNPETLHALGFEFGQEVTIEQDAFDALESGEPITMDNYKKYA